MQSNAAVGNLYSGARPVYIFEIKYDEYNLDSFATLQHMQKKVKITVFSRVNHTAQALLLKCLDPSNKRSHVHCCASHSETTAYNERCLMYATSC
jgi:hypothetical protein